MNDENKKHNADLTGYRIGKLTVLQLMGILAVVGLVVTICLHYFF